MKNKKQKILIVDDSKVTSALLEQQLKETINNIDILIADNYKEALKFILQYNLEIDIAIIDLHLPDSKDGAMVDVIESYGIKSVVLSGTLDENSKKIIFNKSCVVDCIAKDGKKSIKSVVTSVNRELKNKGKNILVVDDSKMQLNEAKKILKKMNLNVITAYDGIEAYEILSKGDKKISLVLTDYSMPHMDGMELTFKIRELFDKDELGIIVLSANHQTETLTQFLKIGANDYINKPYSEMEMMTRINANLDIIDLFEKTKDMANKDFLTGAYNRRFFFEDGKLLLKKAQRKDLNIALAMIDIDYFKNINDTYGHDMGDLAICELTNLLHKYTRESDLTARFGGEEFCMLIDNISLEDTQKLFEKLRENVQNHVISIGDVTLSFTISIGIYHGKECGSLSSILKCADKGLYQAKNNGRNQICINQTI